MAEDDVVTELAGLIQELKPGIATWAAIYQHCLDMGLPEEVAIHYVKLLMGRSTDE